MALGPDLFAEVLNAIWAAIKMTVTALEGYAALHRRHLGSVCLARLARGTRELAMLPTASFSRSCAGRYQRLQTASSAFSALATTPGHKKRPPPREVEVLKDQCL